MYVVDPIVTHSTEQGCRGFCFVILCCDSQGSAVLQHLSLLVCPLVRGCVTCACPAVSLPAWLCSTTQPQMVSFLFLLSAGPACPLPHGRCPEVGTELTACPLGPLRRHSETDFPRMRTSGGCWLGWEQGGRAGAGMASCSGTPGVCRAEVGRRA